MTPELRVVAITLVLFLGAFGATLFAAEVIDDGGSGGSARVAATATSPVSLTVVPLATSTPLPTPTATPVPHRRDCAAIAGTEYQSEAERQWFLANCTGSVTSTPVPTATRPAGTPAPGATSPSGTPSPLATSPSGMPRSLPQAPGPTQPPGTATQVVSITTPRAPGQTASVSVRTSPGAICSIMYTTPSGTISISRDLAGKTADGAGNVSWSWTIGSNTNPGTGSVRVTCGGQTATAQIQIS